MSELGLEPGAKLGNDVPHTNYFLEGRADVPVLVLSHSLGVASAMWDAQMPALREHFRVLRYDTRGHGGSAAPAGEYSIAELGQDVLALLDELGLERVHFCGLSMGGMIGQWLGVHAPERLHSLTLANTAARIGTENGWNARIEQVRAAGMAGVVDAVLERWFTPAARAQPALTEPVRAMLLATSPTGYTGCCAAIRDMDQRGEVAAIRTPALIIAGSEDAVTPSADGAFLEQNIPGARLVELPAAHLSNIEAASEFTGALLSFLARHTETAS